MSSFPKNIGISVLTGFLGSGKTTVLTSLIKQKQMANAAIIINEFGEVGLDHDLIETTDENVIELQNGCIWIWIKFNYIRVFRFIFHLLTFFKLLVML